MTEKATIDVEKEELMKALTEAEEKLQAIENERKDSLIKELCDLTGKKPEIYTKYDEEAIKEMINLAKEKEEIHSKGVVVEEEPKPQVKEEISFSENDGGSYTYTEEKWSEINEELRDLSWIERDGYFRTKKGVE